jgi:hypothetical protein
MNLLFVTVELERSRMPVVPVGRRSRETRWFRSRPFRWIVLTAAALLGASLTALAGWTVSGGEIPVAAGVSDWLPISTASAAADPSHQARLDIASEPEDATVMVDGRERGKTPLSTAVAIGEHTLILKNPAAIDDERKIAVPSDMHVNVRMFFRRPDAMQLKPAYPGASINSASFLADGRLSLSMAVPVATGNAARPLTEVWILDPVTGSLAPFNAASNPRAPIIVASPDGNRVAYAQARQSTSGAGSSTERATDVLVAADDGSEAVTVFELPTVSGNSTSNNVEEVHNLAWTPDGKHLVVTVRSVGGYSSASRSQLLLVDAEHDAERQTAPVELVTLPAEIIAGSYTWAADGKWVAFLTLAASGSGGASFLALGAADTTAGGAVSGFRYIADLGRQSDALGPLPVAPIGWSPSGDARVVFAAPTPKVTVSNPLGLPTTSGGEPGLFVATPTGPALSAEEGQRLGSATGLIAPTWPAADDTSGTEVLALARSSQASKPLTIRAVDTSGGTVRNLDIVLPPTVGGSGTVTARWDLAHGRLLVLARHDSSNSGLLDYWLVQLRAPATGGI